MLDLLRRSILNTQIMPNPIDLLRMPPSSDQEEHSLSQMFSTFLLGSFWVGKWLRSWNILNRCILLPLSLRGTRSSCTHGTHTFVCFQLSITKIISTVQIVGPYVWVGDVGDVGDVCKVSYVSSGGSCDQFRVSRTIGWDKWRLSFLVFLSSFWRYWCNK